MDEASIAGIRALGHSALRELYLKAVVVVVVVVAAAAAVVVVVDFPPLGDRRSSVKR